jgi:hypothetical protein
VTIGSKHPGRDAVLVITTLTVLAGLFLPAFGYPQVRRLHPTVTLTQCEHGGGIVEARQAKSTVCVGGLDDGDPVVGE